MLFSNYGMTSFQILWLIIIENGSYRKFTKGEKRMAEIHKKRSAHTEEATIPGFTSFSKKSQCLAPLKDEGWCSFFLFQLCYVDPGIASEEEMEKLKTVDSVFIEL